MMDFRPLRWLVASLLIAVLWTGCFGKTPSAVYYTLSPIENGAPPPATASGDPLVVGIGPIKFPDELDRIAIVTRSGRNRLEVNEFRRWGGSLEENIARVMEENLTTLLETDQVMTRPWERHFRPDVRVGVDFRRFDGRLGEYALLNATWTIIGSEAETPLLVRRTIIQEAVADDSYDALVEAQSRALAKLCGEIAAAVADKFPTRLNETPALR